MQPTSPSELIMRTKETGLRRLQCALDPLRENAAIWGVFPQQCVTHGIQLVSGMFGTIGEDYSTMESIRRTGGVVPDATWEQNWKNIQEIARIAQQLELPLVTFHAGFLPHEESDPDFQKLLDRIGQIADFFSQRGVDLGFETGQETAETLSIFLKKLDRKSVGVNFDPANMILYDKGDPIQALRTLGPWLKQCHLKDAKKTRTPGAWGEEVPVGTGEVDWRAFFQTLAKLNFAGYCAFEREAGAQRVADIRVGHQYVINLLK